MYIIIIIMYYYAAISPRVDFYITVSIVANMSIVRQYF